MFCLLGILFMQLGYSADSKNFLQKLPENNVIISPKEEVKTVLKDQENTVKPNDQIFSKLNSKAVDPFGPFICMEIHISCSSDFTFRCGTFAELVVFAYLAEQAFCND